jgi:hypothetical protein
MSLLDMTGSGRAADCQALMERQFDSFMVACEFAIYILLMYALLRTLLTLVFYHLWWASVRRPSSE